MNRELRQHAARLAVQFDKLSAEEDIENIDPKTQHKHHYKQLKKSALWFQIKEIIIDIARRLGLLASLIKLKNALRKLYDPANSSAS